MDARPADRFLLAAAGTSTLDDLAGLLRALRRRHARREGHRVLSYRTLAARAGWSHTAVAEYLTGKTLPPTDRFDVLVGLLGASPVERGALASARDRVDEQRRVGAPSARAGTPSDRGGGNAAGASAGASAGHPAGGPPETAGSGPAGPAGPHVPRQLPPALRYFSGRRTELAQLAYVARLAGGGDPHPPQAGTIRIVAVSGTAGVGKTTLAVHWAHQVAGRFPDGQLYLNLRGFDPDGSMTEPATALRVLLDALGAPPTGIPADLDAQAALYRTMVAGRRLLIVLDNARDSAHVRLLVPSAPDCLVIVTSRNQLTGLVAAHGAHPVTLGLLPESEAVELLRQRIGARRCRADPAATDEIVSRCAGLPLALAIVAARAATAPQMPLAGLAAELRTAQHRLDALCADDPDLGVRAVFSWSYQALTPAAAQLFRLIGVHPGPVLSVPAAASLAGQPYGQVRPLLAELVRTHLLNEYPGGRYGLHDLLRVYAAERLRAEEPPAVRDAALRRLTDHYLHSAYRADRLVQPTPDLTGIAPAGAGVVAEEFADNRAALDWFAMEHPTLLAVFDLVAAAGLDRPALHLAQAMSTFLDRRGHWRDLLATQHAALELARRLADPVAQAVAHRGIARGHTRTGRYDEAYVNLVAALELYRDRGDQVGQGITGLNLALLRERQGRHRDALGHARHAFEWYAAAGDRRGQGKALNVVGWQHALLGEYQATLVHCQRALDLLREFDDRPGQASTWDSLGFAHHHLGDHDEADRCYRQALALFREVGDRHVEALVLNHLAELRLATGDTNAARVSWQSAADILDSLDHPDAGSIRARLAELGR
ncbi:tetratricopeptide repeat protein [Solwaraspora sp. WMMD406]|uniref:ATP-binding protein n=1 Tax=Solwaraspora sp. WMMD406 TaxID=3016095 RepID=UPI002417E460|nr:helix-turn-helix domain-containing protein [Solwaraspora sp. WMMD406]MDG4765085.1 tetratricopeptide repeat protein [Solwaraspora sp. WMMD406]